MKLYRYLNREEFKKIKAGEIDQIGYFYNDTQRYKQVNNHKYKQNTRYLHFYLSKKNIERIKKEKFIGSSLFYICEFNIPFYVILPYIGYGIYSSQRGWFNNSSEKVYEVAFPAEKMKQKYFIKYEVDKDSGSVWLCDDITKKIKKPKDSQEQDLEK